MSAIDEIIGYKKNPDEDLYGMLNCNEHSTVSERDDGYLLVLIKTYFFNER